MAAPARPPSTPVRWLERMDTGLTAIAGFALVAMMLLICADAFGRYLLQTPLPGANEIVSHQLLIPLVFLMLSANYATGDHVRLEVGKGVLSRVLGSPSVQERLVAALSLLVFLPYGVVSVMEAFERTARLDATLGVVPLPVWLSYIWVAIGVWALNARLVLAVFVPRAARRNGNEETGP